MFAFRKCKSIIKNLTVLISDIEQTLLRKHNMAAAVIDNGQAFGNVNSNKIIKSITKVEHLQ